MSAQVKIDRIDPTDWFAGMKDPSLQLMIYGKDIRTADVTTNYPGVKVDSWSASTLPTTFSYILTSRMPSRGQ